MNSNSNAKMTKTRITKTKQKPKASNDTNKEEMTDHQRMFLRLDALDNTLNTNFNNIIHITKAISQYQKIQKYMLIILAVMSLIMAVHLWDHWL